MVAAIINTVVVKVKAVVAIFYWLTPRQLSCSSLKSRATHDLHTAAARLSRREGLMMPALVQNMAKMTSLPPTHK